MFDKLIQDTQSRRAKDVATFEAADGDLCMLCHAYGADKRSLIINCFYAMNEVVPEMLDLTKHEPINGWYLRICKTCRGALLQHMEQWRDERLALRGTPKDHDGYPEDSEGDIPVRVNGATVMMTAEQYAGYQAKHAALDAGARGEAE